MARRAARKDLVHNSITDIIAELRDKYNCPIQFKDTQQIKGFCDFVVTAGGEINVTDKEKPFLVGSRGLTVLVEVKTGNKGITDAEWNYLKKCWGNYILVNCFEDLIAGMYSCANDTKHLNALEKIEKTYYNKMLGKPAPWEYRG